MQNAEIELILSDIVLDGTIVALAYMRYLGHGEPYIVYNQYDKDNSYSTDDDIAGYITYYDFDIYAKGNYFPIVEEIKSRLKKAGWTWQPRRDSPDMYDPDTEYYHKTVCFGKPVQEDGDGDESYIALPIDDVIFPK